MILNEIERAVICGKQEYRTNADFIDAIEAAVIAKLSQGVSVEPYATLHHDDGYFTTKQREHDLRYSGPMRTDVYAAEAIAAARVQENARIVELCKKRWKGGYPQEVIDDLVIAIHALLGKEAQS